MRITTTDVYLDTLCLLIYTSDEVSRALAEDILKVFEEDAKVNPIVDNPETRFWLGIIQDIVENKIDTSKSADMAAFLRKYKENNIAKINPDLIETLQDVLDGRKDVGSARIDAMKKNISNWLIFYHIEQSNKKASKLLGRYPSIINPEKQQQVLDEIYELCKTMVKAHEEAISPEIEQVDFVDFSSRDSIKKILNFHKKRTTSGVMRFGMQRLNMMLNPELKGVKPGEFGCIISPSHHGKTYTLMNMARWIALYNKPQVKDGYKPAIVFISLENELDENVNTWFHDAYVNMFHKKPNSLSDDEIADSVATEYGKNGYSLLVFRRLANQFGFDEYVALIQKLQQARYHICASFIDYVSMMKVDTILGGSTHAAQLQYLVRNIRTFSNHEQIATWTAMQVDREGARQIGGNQSYIVKRFNQSTLADCSYAYHEFDIVIFQAIERIDNQGVYLTMKLDKHRSSIIDPLCRYGFWRFGSLGILDDINGNDTSIEDIYNDSFSASDNPVLNNPFTTSLKEIMPTPPTKEGKEEMEEGIVISKIQNPNKSLTTDYFTQIGSPKVINTHEKIIPAEPAIITSVTKQEDKKRSAIHPDPNMNMDTSVPIQHAS